MYLFDVHVHTAEVSHCAHLTAAQTIDTYAELGYSGVCITDHYSQDALYKDIQEPIWEKKIAAYQRGYYLAKEQGEKRGLTVLFGMEMHVADYPDNEYLVYGLTADFVAQNKDLWQYTLPEFREIANAMRALCQATGGLTEEELLREALQIFGYVRMTPRISARMERARVFALRHNMVELDGEHYQARTA